MMGSCAALAMVRRLSLASRASAAYSTDGITIRPCTPIAWACSAKRQALRVRVSLTLTSTGTRPSATASAVLAERTAGQQRMHAAVDLEREVALHFGEIEIFIFLELGRYGGEDSCPFFYCHAVLLEG